MRQQQNTPMKYNPITGGVCTYDISNAARFRERFPGKNWRYNPWTGSVRHTQHLVIDPYGLLIIPPGEPRYAAPPMSDEHEALTFGPLTNDINTALADRANRYGVFADQARIVQNIKAAMRDSKNWHVLRPDQKEALEMVAHKIGRILNGDPN
jgi:hypothetical protein